MKICNVFLKSEKWNFYGLANNIKPSISFKVRGISKIACLYLKSFFQTYLGSPG